MNTPRSASELSDAVEALARTYVEDARAQILAGLDRGLGTISKVRSSRASGQQKTNPATKPKRRYGARRTPEALAELSERLYEQIIASPGGAMTTFASELGIEVRALQHPAGLLKKANRVRTTGIHHHTRYFAVP